MQGERSNTVAISNKVRWAAHILAIIGILASFILSVFFRKALFIYGVQFIYSIQNPPSDASRIFFNIFDFFGESFVLGPIFGLIYLIIYRKFNGMVYLIFVALNIFLITLTKNSFQDGRPFWEYQFINQLQWSCPTQYGYPSGHAWISVLLFEPILTDFTGLGPFRWALFFIAITGTLIPLCRLYLGVHSVDQILTGLVMSTAMLTIYRFGLQKLIFHYLYMCLTSIRHQTKLLIGTIVVNGLFMMGPVIIFSINTTVHIVSDERLAQVNARCQKDLTYYTMQKKHGLQGIIGCAIFGMVYGVFLASKFGGIDFWASYYLGHWKYGKKRNIFFKLLLYILMAGFFAGIFIVLIPHFIEDFYGAYFVSIIGVILSGASVTFGVPYAARKLKIIHQKIPLPEVPTNNDGQQFNKKSKGSSQSMVRYATFEKNNSGHQQK